MADRPSEGSTAERIERARALENHGRTAEAEALYRDILATAPSDATALNLLGLLCYRSNRLREAAQLIERALAVHARDAQAEGNLGAVLAAEGNLDAAIVHFRAAAELAPDKAASWANLGAALQNAGDFPNGRIAMQRAIALGPNDVGAWRNLGLLEVRSGNNEAGLRCFTRILELDADNVEGHVWRGFALLRAGRFGEGWPEYEWRLDPRSDNPLDRGFSMPQWKGEELRGRRLLLHAEQGFGDTIQFLRYLPSVRDRGGTLWLEIQPALRRLLNASPVSRGINLIDRGEALPRFDLHCPLGSLPGIFRTDLGSIPRTVPYLNVDPTWEKILPARGGRRRVGFVWAGSPTHTNDRNRSLPGSMLEALAGLRQIDFVSLQKTSAPPPLLTLIDVSSKLDDFAATASALMEIDLLISVDTSVAHLAGALGRQAWVLLPYAADWRWFEQREDSPWYPSLRLFRQPRPGDWPEVIERVRRMLLEMV